MVVVDANLRNYVETCGSSASDAGLLRRFTNSAMPR